MKSPAFQFYPADWRKDPGVQSLDYETRGIWFEIICIMHESEERGVLMLNGAPMPDAALARMLGLDNQKLQTTLTTLLTYGVAKRRESDGAVYSKRMVSDEKLRQIRKEAGSLGGNPVLVKQKSTTLVKQIPTPSSSSSTSVLVPPTPLTGGDASPPASQPAESKSKSNLEEAAIVAVHEAIQTASGRRSTLNPATRKLIVKFLDAGFNAADYALVARFMRYQNKMASEERFKVAIGNGLIERLPKFEDRLVQAQGWARNQPKPETPRDRAMASIGRPTVQPEKDPQTTAQIIQGMGLLKQTLSNQVPIL